MLISEKKHSKLLRSDFIGTTNDQLDHETMEKDAEQDINIITASNCYQTTAELHRQTQTHIYVSPRVIICYQDTHTTQSGQDMGG